MILVSLLIGKYLTYRALCLNLRNAVALPRHCLILVQQHKPLALNRLELRMRPQMKLHFLFINRNYLQLNLTLFCALILLLAIGIE